MNAGWVAALGFLAALYVAACGWGRAAVQAARWPAEAGWAFCAALGLAVWVFLGGLLNVVGLAYPAALYSIVAAGWIFFALGIKRSGAGRFRPALRDIPAAALGLTAVLLAAATLAPAAIFNSHDDFRTYLPRLEQMLVTGTLAGNPFDTLGLDSLGGQTFLQAFVLAVFPLQYLHGMDAVLCYGAGIALLFEIARRLDLPRAYALVPALLFIVIQPQTVNLSALYSGSLMILGLAYCGVVYVPTAPAALADGRQPLSPTSLPQAGERDKDTLSRTRERDGERGNGAAMSRGAASFPLAAVLPLALFTAALCALKVTLAPYAAVYFAAYCGAMVLVAPDRRRAALLALTAAAAVAVALLPWLLTYGDHYAALFAQVWSGNRATALAQAQSASFSLDVLLSSGRLHALFSSERLFYGGSALAYGGAAVLLLLACGCGVTVGGRGKKEERGLAAGLFAVSIAAVAAYAVNLYWFDMETGLRYFSPVLIAALPAAGLLAGGLWRGAHPPARAPLAVVALVQLAAAGLFLGAFLERTEVAYRLRTPLAFQVGAGDAKFNAYALSAGTRDAVRRIQGTIPQNQTMLAWIAFPFHLDFSRNRIYAVAEPGWGNDWLDLPADGDGQGAAYAQYFKDRGIRYIMWQRQGASVRSEWDLIMAMSSSFQIGRKMAASTLRVYQALKEITENSVPLYSDDEMVVLDLGA